MVGFNDMPFIDRLRPPLTTVRFPYYQLGTEAAQLLLERVANRDCPVKILCLAPELIVRGLDRAARGRRQGLAGRGDRPGLPGDPRGAALGACSRSRSAWRPARVLTCGSPLPGKVTSWYGVCSVIGVSPFHVRPRAR